MSKIVKSGSTTLTWDDDLKAHIDKEKSESSPIHDAIPYISVSQPTEAEYWAFLRGCQCQQFLVTCSKGHVVLRGPCDPANRERFRIIANYFFQDIEFFEDRDGKPLMTTIPNLNLDRAKVIEDAKAVLGIPDWVRERKRQADAAKAAVPQSGLISSNLPPVVPEPADEDESEEEES